MSAIRPVAVAPPDNALLAPTARPHQAARSASHAPALRAAPARGGRCSRRATSNRRDGRWGIVEGPPAPARVARGLPLAQVVSYSRTLPSHTSGARRAGVV